MKALIADEQWIARAGLSQVLASLDGTWEIVETTTFHETKDRLAAGGIDICLVDPGLPGAPPLDAVAQLSAAAPGMPLAVLSMRDSRRDALRALEMGAQGYILKSASADDIRRAIQRLVAGEISLPSNLRDGAVEGPRGFSESAAGFSHGPVGELDSLTYRQREVLSLIATGKRNADIGKMLNISPRTVQIHVSTILKLLGVGNRTEAALVARRHGLGE